jgi:hypothetical protein
VPRPKGSPAAGGAIDDEAKRQIAEYRAAVARMRERIAKLAADTGAGQAATIDKITGTWEAMKSDLAMFVRDRDGSFTKMAEDMFQAASRDAIARVNRIYADDAIRDMSAAEMRAASAAMRRNPINGGSLDELMGDADARTMTRVRAAFLSAATAPGAAFADIVGAVKAALGTDLTGMLRVIDTVGNRVLNQAIDVGFRWSADQWVRELVGDAVDSGELVEVWRHNDAQANPREQHIAMNGQIKGSGGLFTAPDGAQAEYPGAFGDPEHDAYCDCWIEYLPRDEAEKLYGKS